MLVWPDHRYLKVVSNKNRLRHPSPTFTHSRYSHNFEVPSFVLFQSQVITPTLNFLLKVWISNIGSSLICNFKASISFQLYFIIEIKPEICKVVENLFWRAHVKEHVRIIGQYRKIGSRPRNFAWVNSFLNFKPQNFGKVATVTWICLLYTSDAADE